MKYCCKEIFILNNDNNIVKIQLKKQFTSIFVCDIISRHLFFFFRTSLMYGVGKYQYSVMLPRKELACGLIYRQNL